MRNMMKKAAQNVKAVAVRAGMLMKDTKGENYVDTAGKNLIAGVFGGLLLGGAYGPLGGGGLATLTQRAGFINSCRLRRIKRGRIWAGYVISKRKET